MILQTIRAVGVAAALLALAAPAAAQRVLDWPLRTSAGPEAVTRGVEAVFWNPAGIAARDGRGEFLVADQRSPDAIGIGGFAAAAAWRLDARTTIAAGYQHVAIDDIGETSTSPLPGQGEPTFSVFEDQIAVGVSHALGGAVTAGGGVRLDRSNEDVITQSTTSLNAGFAFAPALPLRPVLGVSVLTRGGGVRYGAGVELAADPVSDLEVRGGYGVRGGDEVIAVEHRLGATVTWRSLFSATAGFVTTTADDERTYEPVFGAALRISRYELGVLREGLANDFGAAYAFRFKLGLK